MSTHPPQSSRRIGVTHTKLLHHMKKAWYTGLSLTVAASLLLGSWPNRSFAANTTDDGTSTIATQMNSDPGFFTVNDTTSGEREINFNSDWKFLLSDTTNASTKSFDDSSWEDVTLPHDFSITQDYSPSNEAESAYLPGGTGWYRKEFTLADSFAGKHLYLHFDGAYMDTTVWVNGQALGENHYGYSPFTFDITPYINYAGVNVVAVKVVNNYPSSRWYSGSGIYRDVTLIATDAVHVAEYGTQISTPHLEKQLGGAVDVNVNTRVVNDSDKDATVSLTYKLYKKGEMETPVAEGTLTDQAISAKGDKTISGSFSVQNPDLWTTENPNLYELVTEVVKDGQVVDSDTAEWGFRYFHFDRNAGFSLNGKKLKLQGVSMHHDQGSLGAVANLAAIERQVKILKDMGVNSIRVTHNPAAKNLIDVCNREGIIVIEEAYDTWNSPKNGNTYDFARWFSKGLGTSNTIYNPTGASSWGQFAIQQMVLRDRNDPSVIMWSLGNEIFEGIGAVDGDYVQFAKNLTAWTHDVDPTRPVTFGDNQIKNLWHRGANGVANVIANSGGVVGTNYSNGESYDTLFNRNPSWILYGSETASSVNSRGYYLLTSARGQTSSKQLPSYDDSYVGWGASASAAWYDVITRDFVAGTYVWTGFDYLGEPTFWNGTAAGARSTWPSPKNSYFGIIDTAGFPKDSYYLYRSQWNKTSHTLHILPAWNANVVNKDSGSVKVVVYSDAPNVELFFTPKGSSERQSLGKKHFTTKTTGNGFSYQVYEGADKSGEANKNLYLTWNVPWQEGTLEAVATDDSGSPITDTVGRNIVSTTAAAAKLHATVDRSSITADGADLSYVTVDVEDADGNVVPDAENRVTFNVEGPGKLVGVDNGNSIDHDSYQANNRRAFAGKVLAIIQSTHESGEIHVTATADGLESSAVTITSAAPEGSESTAKAVHSIKYARNYYVKTGNTPKLPDTLEVRYTDGSSEMQPVSWDAIDPQLLEQAGSFEVAGKVLDHKIAVSVTMLDEIAGILNYSTTTPVGTNPTLPETRPVVLPNGEVLPVELPVVWDALDSTNYATEGTTKVHGTVSVFGKTYEVSANVRAINKTVTISDNVAPAAHLSQSIDASEQSDNINAINDGNKQRDFDPNTAWSNWAYSRNRQGQNPVTSSITMRYDTQQYLGKATVYFFQDSQSATYPEPNTTVIEVSEDGENWTRLATKETIGKTTDQLKYVKPYTYEFSPSAATYVRFTFTNPPRAGKAFTCVVVSEIELNLASEAYVVNNSADLTKLVVNGDELSDNVIAKGSYNTEAILADVEAESSQNASITMLPEYEGVIRIITESEDHASRKTFSINLNTKDAALEADDKSRDVASEHLQRSASSSQDNSGNAPGNAGDYNAKTIWHSSWSNTPAFSSLWYQIALDSAKKVDGLRYLPRPDGANGTIVGYKVVTSMDGQNWTTVSQGSWDKEYGWKQTSFEPTLAKYVRLIPTETAGDRTNTWTSAAEIHVRSLPDQVDLTDTNNNVTVDVPKTLTVDSLEALQDAKFDPKDIHVRVGDRELRYGKDYLISYKDNSDEGPASLTIRGIVGYSGEIERNFNVDFERKVVAIALKQGTDLKQSYVEDDVFDPTNLVLELAYNDNTVENLSYPNEGISFTPALDHKLTLDDKEVVVSYEGLDTRIPITVDRKLPDPAKVTGKLAEITTTGDSFEGKLPAELGQVGTSVSVTHDNNIYQANEPKETTIKTKDGTWTFAGYSPKSYSALDAYAYLNDQSGLYELPFSAMWSFKKSESTEPVEPTVPDGGEATNATLTLSVNGIELHEVEQGQSLSITATGFEPGHSVVFTLHSEPIELGRAVADENGSAAILAVIPKDTPVGEHMVYATDAADATHVAKHALRVVAAREHYMPNPPDPVRTASKLEMQPVTKANLPQTSDLNAAFMSFGMFVCAGLVLLTRKLCK